MLDPAVETAVRSYRLWLQARGVPPPARVCFTSRLRRFLRWFQSRYRIAPLPSIVSGQAVYLYREHLYDQGLSAEYIRSLVYPARTYHMWAVETGELDEPPLPPMFRPPAGLQMKRRKPMYFSVPFVGREKYLQWAVRQGIGPRTLRHYRGTLSSIARWLRDSRAETLGPAHAKPELLKPYFEATGRSSSSYDSVRFALRSYARWATQEGLLSKDPFVSPYRGRLVDPSAREARVS